jgi:hypothetical protein
VILTWNRADINSDRTAIGNGVDVDSTGDSAYIQSGFTEN